MKNIDQSLEILYEFIKVERDHFNMSGMPINHSRYSKRIKKDIEQFKTYRVPIEYFKLPMHPSVQESTMRYGLEMLGFDRCEILAALEEFFGRTFKVLPSLTKARVISAQEIEKTIRVKLNEATEKMIDKENTLKKEYDIQQQIKYYKQKIEDYKKQVEYYKKQVEYSQDL